MTSDQRFRRWVRGALLIAVFSFVYFLIADLWMPMTSQARVMHPVVSVASRVSGRIDEVLVHDNQHVEAGDVLFRIDAKPYQLAVQQAELALEAAIQGWMPRFWRRRRSSSRAVSVRKSSGWRWRASRG